MFWKKNPNRENQQVTNLVNEINNLVKEGLEELRPGGQISGELDNRYEELGTRINKYCSNTENQFRKEISRMQESTNRNEALFGRFYGLVNNQYRGK